jgi:DNA polymerase-3 subunit alpha
VKGCGRAAVEAIVAARRTGGPFVDLFDFCERVDPSAVGRSTIETLIKAGAFDSFGPKRAQHMAVLERAIQAGSALHADRKSGQKGLFDSLDEPDDVKSRGAAALPDMPEWEDRERLAAEKEVLGFYLSSHPLAEHAAMLSAYCSHATTDLGQLAHRTEVVLGGMLSALKIAQSRNPKPGTLGKYAMFDLEDMAGSVRCILWPDGYEQFASLVKADATLVVRGAVDRRPGSDETNLIVNELIPLDQLHSRFTKGIRIRVGEALHGERGLEDLYEILRGYPGSCDLELVVWLADGTRVSMQPQRMRVDMNAEMRARVDALLGPGNLQLVAAPPPRPAPRRTNGAALARS